MDLMVIIIFVKQKKITSQKRKYDMFCILQRIIVLILIKAVE